MMQLKPKQTNKCKTTQTNLELSNSTNRCKDIGSNEDVISIPGFHRILRPANSSFKRILWALLMGMCFVFCTWMLYDRLSLYFKAPTTLDSRPSLYKQVQFPAVTFCPVQEPFNEEAPFYFIFLKERGRNYADMNNETFHSIDDMDFQKLNVTLQDVWKNSAILKTDITVFSSCAVVQGKQVCNYQTGIETKITEKTYDTFLGECRMFTLDLLMEYRGPATNLNFKFTHLGELQAQTSKVHTVTGRKYSAKYMIHSHDTYQPHDAYLLSSYLSTGWQNVVRLLVKEYHFINKTSKPCRTEADYHHCRNYYTDERLEMHLNCSLPFMRTRHIPQCSTWRTAKETHSQIKNFYNMGLNVSYCKCRKCRYHTYIQHAAKNQMQYDDDYTLLTLEFADNYSENVTEIYIYEFLTLLSDVAASLGFFLGISVLTLFEVAESMFAKVVKWKTK